MRNLIISREDSALARDDEYLVYIEDYAIPECKVDGLPVRKLGTIKNGEIARFRIADHEAKVFVVKNKFTRNYSNACYHVDEGNTDVFLSGKCTKKLLKFNPFCFENGDSPEVEQFRSKIKRKRTMKFLGISAVLITVFYIAMSGMLSSWVNSDRDVYQPEGWRDDASVKVFEEPNITITMTENFTAHYNHQGYYVVYTSEKITAFVVRESFETYPDFEKLSLVEYGNMIVQVNKLGEVEVKEEDGVGYFTFNAVSSSNKENYVYYAYLYKGSDACWFVHFAVPESEVAEYGDDVEAWAKTIKIK